MRLTLRTLLAYMDDRLPPANAKELGQKITKSPFATDLVERIRDVKRRRRLASPARPTPMIDANLIAEYLDDQLTPELVAKIEKEVLASDAMLAEVASAHEILGMLSDPVTIEPQLRERLYELDPTGRTDVVRALVSESPAKPTITSNVGEWKPLPDPGQSVRRVPVIIAVGLAIVWLATVVSDSVLFETATDSKGVAGFDNAAADSEQSNNEIAPVEVAGVASTDSKPDSDNGDPAGSKAGVVADIASALEPKVAVPIDSPVASAEPVTDVPKPAATDLPTGQVTLKSDDLVQSNNEEARGAEVPVHAMTSNKTFFVFDESVDRWMRLDQIPGGEVVSTTRNNSDCRSLFQQRWFAVAEPFTANLAADDRGWIAMLVGGVLGRLSASRTQGLEIYSGRIKVSVDAAQPWADDNVPMFGLTSGGVTAVLVLQSQDAVMGIDVSPRANSLEIPGQSDIDPHSAASLLHLNGSDFQVKVMVVTGQVLVRLSGIEQEFTLSTGKGLTWLAPGAQDPAAVSSTPENITLADSSLTDAIPAWLHSDTKPVPEAEALNTQIREALAGSEDPALAVIPLLEDRNPQLGVNAVRILTATHDVDRLLSALFENLDEAVHRSAIDGLSYIANASSEGRRTIQHALETRIPMSEVDITVSLIQGFGDAEARDAAYCQSLIDLLNNDRLATRTLAFYRIQQYSNDRLGYQPEAESSRRRDSVRRWQKFLDRNGGKLLQ